jgi:hypothetical protein
MAAPEPEATAAASYTPIVTDLSRLVRAPFTPGRVFEEQKDSPTFWMPWAILAIVSIVLQFLQRPFQQRVREVLLQQLGRPAPPGGAGAVSAVLGAVFGVVTLLALLAISAGVLYLLLMIFGGESRYKKILTVVVFAWPVVILQQVLTFIVLSMRGLSSINGVWDMFVSFGADLLLPSDAHLGAFARVFLAGIGPLAIWQVAITAVGLTIMGKASKGAAWSVATIGYLIGLLIGSGLAAFGMKMAGG